MTIKEIPGISIYGDMSFRDKECPRESVEQITFVARIRNRYPFTYGKIIAHFENEGQLKGCQFSGINKSKAMGMAKGAPDIIIPSKITFICELKRKDRTVSHISPEQIEYLMAAKCQGAFVCVALGCDAATDAFHHWVQHYLDK